MSAWLTRLSDWFDAFTTDFLSRERGDELPLRLKIEHSLKVRDEAVFLAGAQGLSSDMCELALAAGLLHDIGRFPQYEKYRTFKDPVSVNHGLLGVLTLRRAHELEDVLPAGARPDILAAVACHNRKRIPKGLAGRARELTALTRDADKLDIARIMLDHLRPDGQKHHVVVLELNPDPGGLTESMLKAIYHETNTKYSDMVYTNDFCLLLLSWLFDFNSFTARQAYFQRGFVDKFFEILPITRQTQDLRRFLFDRFRHEAA